MPKKINDGTDAEEDFKSFFNDQHGKKVFIERLPDTKSVRSQAKGAIITARPSDYLMTLNGYMFYAEIKSCGEKVSFPFGNIRPYQWKTLIRQVAADGKYYFFVYNTETKLWYVIEGREILAIKDQGRNSIKWTEAKRLHLGWMP